MFADLSDESPVNGAAEADGLAGFAGPPVARLRWLVRLRWAALSAVVVGLLIDVAARFPWVSPGPIATAVVVGVLYNLGFVWRLERRELREPSFLTPTRLPGTGTARKVRRELELHAVADVAALTMLLAACGGLRNPIVMFYGFHVVLGAVLGLYRGAVFAGGVAMLGIGLLWGAEQEGMLLSQPLYSPPLWLSAGATSLTVLSLAYFALGALRFLRREQGRAARNYELLMTAMDTLQVGLELVGPGDRLILQNRCAAAIHPLPQPGDRWAPPEDARAQATKGSPRRFARLVHQIHDPDAGAAPEGQEGGDERIFEVMAPAGWEGPRDGLRAFLYVDRTEVTVNEQRAIMMERLASLGRALQGVAHELNTPLASIQTLAVDLSHWARSPGPASGEARTTPTEAERADAAESIMLIIDEARRCREITRELLRSARDDKAGRGEETLRARTVIKDVVRRAERLAGGGSGAVGKQALSITGDLTLACTTDADRLLQILVNLIQNARDASDQTIEVRMTRRDGMAVVEVIDQGPGLPAEVMGRLFSPFVSTKPPGKGTGLGLYTCARLAQQLDGELALENRPGGGVRARLSLPLLPRPSSSTSGPGTKADDIGEAGALRPGFLSA